jgi:hypothetical protein
MMSLRIGLGLSLIGLVSIGMSFNVAAQQNGRCLPHDEMLKHLSQQFKEKPVAMGVSDNGSLLELFATPDGATWTALVTRPNGVSCVVMSGDTWQYTPPQTLANLPL